MLVWASSVVRVFLFGKAFMQGAPGLLDCFLQEASSYASWRGKQLGICRLVHLCIAA